MGRTRSAICAVFLMGLAALSGGAVPLDLDSERQEAVGGLISSLEELIDWTTQNKLFCERDKIFNQILAFEPDNFRAHKGLGHSRLRDGTWVPPENRKASKDFNPKALSDLPGERKRLTQDFRDRMLDILGRYEAELGPARREQIFSQILLVRPDDLEIRTILGEVLLDDRWVLGESALGKKRRAEIKAAVKKSLDSVSKPEKLLPSEADSDLGVAWKTLIRTDNVRVLSTGGRKEAMRVLQAADAALGLFNVAFGVSASYPDDYSIYVLVHENEEQAFLAAHPAIDPESMSFYLELEGCGLPGMSDCVYWNKKDDGRLDGTTRHTITQLLSATFGLAPEQGWAFEGLGLYLTREMVGTRLTWYVQPGTEPSNYEKKLRVKLLRSSTNWMNEAYEILQGDRRPDLETVLGRNLSEMKVEDLLYSYALAAYLIEGCPDQVGPLLYRIGSGVSPDMAVRQVLEMELEQLAGRVERWLGERR